MPITNTPVILYDAGGKVVGPAGGIRALLQFYRPPVAADSAGLANLAQPVAFGSESSATAVGSPVAISELSIEYNSTTQKTTGRYGESSNDPTVMRGDPTLNCGTFIQSAGEPTIMPGDFVALSIATKITSTAGTPVYCPLSRWVVTNNSLSTAGPNKWSLKLELDRLNSDPALKEF